MVGKIIAGDAISKVASNKYTPWIVGGLVVGGTALAYFGIIKPVLCYTGIYTKNCPEKKQELKVIGLDAFNTRIANPSNITITHEKAKQLADQIYDAIDYSPYRVESWFDDDEEAVYGAISSAGSIPNMSLVSRMYEARYGDALGTKIADSFNEAEMRKVITIIENFKA